MAEQPNTPFGHQARFALVELPELAPEALRAKILYLRSQYGHMDLVTSGQVLPILLRTTRLARLPRSPA